MYFEHQCNIIEFLIYVPTYDVLLPPSIIEVLVALFICLYMSF